MILPFVQYGLAGLHRFWTLAVQREPEAVFLVLVILGVLLIAELGAVADTIF